MENENKNYWETVYDDVIDGIKFKFKQMNPVEHLNLVTKNVEFERLDGADAEYFIKKCLQITLWTKDGSTWNALVDANGNSKLPELASHMSAALDLFYYFKKDVLLPVFTESKTFQRSISAMQEESQVAKNSDSQSE